MTRVDAEAQIILLSAGTAARREAAGGHVKRLLDAVDISRLVEMLCARRLLATLGPRIVELAGEGGLDDTFTTAVDRALAAGRRQSALLQLVCEHIMTALAHAGIRASALKGPLLAEAIYAEPGRRHSSDIDLLVAAEQLSQAVEVVSQLGYCSPSDHVERDGLPRLHFALVHAAAELPPVELHWRIHWYERNFARERLLTPRGSTFGEWRPAPVDELAALLLFYARDGFVGLRLATDLGAWWDAFNLLIEPGELDGLLRSYPELSRPVRVAAMAAGQVVGLPLERILEGVRTPSPRERMALGMVNPNPCSSRAQLHADVGLIDWLLSPPSAIPRVARRQLLVPREVRGERARRAGARNPATSLGHGARVITRYGFTVARLALARR